MGQAGVVPSTHRASPPSISCFQIGALAIAAEHRIGTVPLGEPSVIVAASSAHRPEAFEAARAAIDRIKAEAPIWKAEVEGGESRWVEGTTPA